MVSCDLLGSAPRLARRCYITITAAAAILRNQVQREPVANAARLHDGALLPRGRIFRAGRVPGN